jgi:hypothetical protein
LQQSCQLGVPAVTQQKQQQQRGPCQARSSCSGEEGRQSLSITELSASQPSLADGRQPSTSSPDLRSTTSGAIRGAGECMCVLACMAHGSGCPPML